jgi:hypothetical protein
LSPCPSQDFPAVRFVLAACRLFSSWFNFHRRSLFSRRWFSSSDPSRPVSAHPGILFPTSTAGVDFIQVHFSLPKARCPVSCLKFPFFVARSTERAKSRCQTPVCLISCSKAAPLPVFDSCHQVSVPLPPLDRKELAFPIFLVEILPLGSSRLLHSFCGPPRCPDSVAAQNFQEPPPVLSLHAIFSQSLVSLRFRLHLEHRAHHRSVLADADSFLPVTRFQLSSVSAAVKVCT